MYHILPDHVCEGGCACMVCIIWKDSRVYKEQKDRLEICHRQIESMILPNILKAKFILEPNLSSAFVLFN